MPTRSGWTPDCCFVGRSTWWNAIPAGLIRVTDHKTGKVGRQADQVINGGQSLQPVLYALAAEKLFPDR